MPDPSARVARLRDTLLVILTFAAGAVDAISFLGLGKVFTANMTGNLVLLGLAIGGGASHQAVRAAVSLAAFVGGLIVSGLITRREKRHEAWPARVTAALMLEALLQAGLLAGWLAVRGRPGSVLEAVLVGASGLAMGIQSGAVWALQVSGVTTTYVTGTMTGLIGGWIASRGSALDRIRRGLVLLAILGGAAVSALLIADARRLAPLLPLVLTLTVVGVGFGVLRGQPRPGGE